MELTEVSSDRSRRSRIAEVLTSNMYASQLHELYRYRSLTWNLVVRELKARYRGSTLGFLWSFLNPLLLMCVYALVFSVFLGRWRMQDSYVPLLFSGLLAWLWFSSSLLEASGSILGGGSLIKKVLFPAEVLPLVVVFSNFIHFVLSLPILLLFLIFFRRPISIALLSLPVVMLVQMALTIGLAFLFSALCVHYRDVQHILGNLLTLWFFLTPIVYPFKDVQNKGLLKIPVIINPITPLVVAYQNIFVEGRFPDFSQLLVVAVLAVLTYLLGASIFERYRGTFAEEV